MRVFPVVLSVALFAGCDESRDASRYSPSLSQVRYGRVLAEELDQEVILPEAQFIPGTTVFTEEQDGYPLIPLSLTPDQMNKLADFEDDPAPLENHASYTYGRAGGDLYDADDVRIDFDDVQQGAIGDCYFVAALSAVLYADVDGEIREGLIRPVRDADGDPLHYAVRFYDYAGRPQDVEVDVDLVRSSSGNPTYARSMDSSREDEEWAISLLEKAYAKWHGGYEDIGDGGSPGDVMQALTGSHSSYRRVQYLSDSSVLSIIADGVEARRPLTALTYGEDDGVDYSGTNIYAWHAYTIMGAEQTDDGITVQLRNPWGSSEPAGNGEDDGIFRITGEEFRRLYMGISIGGGLVADSVAPSAVNDLGTPHQDATSVTVSFSATGDDARRGLAYRYDLRVSTEPITDANFYSAERVAIADPQAPGSVEQVQIDGLASGVPVFIAVRVEDESGNVSDISNVITATPADIPVELHPQAVVIDFESTHQQVLEEGLFHVSTTHTVDGDAAMYCGDESTGTYDVGGNASGAVLIDSIDLTPYGDAPVLRWEQRLHTEQTLSYDKAWVEITTDTGDWVVVWEKGETNSGAAETVTVDLSEFAGETVTALFQFDSNGPEANDTLGWVIDDVTFTSVDGE